MTHFLQATNTKGETVYYTGRAGEGWVSTNRAEAFMMGFEYARIKADNFNKWAMLHNLRFVLR